MVVALVSFDRDDHGHAAWLLGEDSGDLRLASNLCRNAPVTKGRSLRVTGPLALSFALTIAFWSIAALGNDDLRAGKRYQILGKLYAYGVADNLNTRQLSVISLNPLNLSGPEIISRQLIPKGSILTIVDRGPKRFLEFLYSDRYIVRVDGLDAPVGIPVVITICCGNQGQSTVLNPAIFKPLP
jgi:hypothetical protein